MSGITSKLLLLNKMKMLVRATSDDAGSTPGYMYEEITNITFGSSGQTAALLDFLVTRLDFRSCYVKLKVLNIMSCLVQKGHPDFAAGLRRNATGINNATMHSGPPHTLCDNAPYVAVRKAASELSAILFDTEKESHSTASSRDTAGYGVSKSKTMMEGFGNTQATQEKTFTDQIKNGIQQLTDSFSAVEGSNHSDSSGRMYKAMPGGINKSYPTNNSTYRGGLVEKPDVSYVVDRRQDVKRSTKKGDAINVENPDIARVSYKGGKAGGGWEDDRSSDGISSGDSNGSTPLSEKLQSVVVEDWNQEAKCVENIVNTKENRLIPSRQELDQLERRCDTLNCDKVLEFLTQKIVSHDKVIQMRALCAIERLLNTDLLGHDNMALQGSLQEVISALGTNKQTVSKAKKILRQIQSTAEQEEIRNTLTHQTKVKTSTERLLTTESLLANLTLNSNENMNQQMEQEEIGQNSASFNISSKLDNSASFVGGSTMESNGSKNGNGIILVGTDNFDNQKDINILASGRTTVDRTILKSELDCTGTSSMLRNCSKNTLVEGDCSNVKESGVSSERTDGCGKKSNEDSLLSSESNISDLLTSLNFKINDVKITSRKDKIPMNQMQQSLPPLQQQSMDKQQIAAMFPQLSTSTLSGSSAVPLQLGKQSSGSFEFIAAQTDTKAKPKMQEKFDFVQEAMKSAITK